MVMTRVIRELQQLLLNLECRRPFYVACSYDKYIVHRTYDHCSVSQYGHILMLVHSVTRCMHSVFFKLASVCIVHSGRPMLAQCMHMVCISHHVLYL